MAAHERDRGPSVPEMSDLQLLTHLIHLSGTEPTRSKALAYALLDKHQMLERVLELPTEELLGFPALSESAATFLRLMSALMERYAAAGENVRSSGLPWGPERAVAMIAPHFQERSKERVCVFCLADNYELISGALVGQGSEEAVCCSVPKVLQLALTHRSKSAIVAHNHPDGVAVFSKSDLLATAMLARALSTVNIPLADHILIAGNELISLRGLFLSGAPDLGPFHSPWSQLDQDWPLSRVHLPLPKKERASG